MVAFDELKAFKKLEVLAEKPIDLTEEGALSPKRINEMAAEGVGTKAFLWNRKSDSRCIKSTF